MKANVKIAPSILSADFTRLGEQIASAEAADADQIHIDIMDGHFVPNLSMGPAIVAAVRRATHLPLDVHLMVEQPERYFDAFLEAGSNALTVHVEACKDVSQTLETVRGLGVKAGVAIKPETSIQTLDKVLQRADIVLVMTVVPGFGGQKFLAGSLPRIAEIRTRLDLIGSAADLSVDGGIDHDTMLGALKAGANVMVAGSAIFGHPEGIANAILSMREAALSLR